MAQFQSFWHGAVGPYQRLAMRSFLDHGHRYLLFSYQDLEVPAGVELRDAREILPEDRVFVYGPKADRGRGSVAAFSNLFRYRLLSERGGWWIDADVICQSHEVPAGEVFMAWEADGLVGNSILKFPPGHQVARDLEAAAEAKGTDLAWGETGPDLLTEHLRSRGLLAEVAPAEVCYPIRSVCAVDLLLPRCRDEIAAKLGRLPLFHLWNEILRRAGVLTWLAPPAGSFVSELFARHGVGFESGYSYRAEEVECLARNWIGAAYWEWNQRHPSFAENHLLQRTQAALEEAQAIAWDRDVQLQKLLGQLVATQAALEEAQAIAWDGDRRQQELHDQLNRTQAALDEAQAIILQRRRGLDEPTTGRS